MKQVFMKWKCAWHKAVAFSTMTIFGACQKAVAFAAMFLGAWKRAVVFSVMTILAMVATFAQDTTTGAGAITQVSKDIAKYIEPVQTLLYAIAGVVALGGAISVFIKMNNEEQDVKKSIMLLIGACIFLIAAAEALPMFFGL